MFKPPNISDYQDAKKFLPEEIKKELSDNLAEARKKLELLLDRSQGGQSTAMEIEEIEAKIHEYEEEIEKLGGDTRKCLEQILEVYNPEIHSKWFVDAYDEYERSLLTRRMVELCNHFKNEQGKPLPVENLVIDDRGMGTGRSLRMLLEIVHETQGMEVAQRFAKNLYGVDLMEKNISLAMKSFAEKDYSVPRQNLTEGSYLDPSERRANDLNKKKAHMILCMMHSSFHCTTEDEWRAFFTQIKEDLLPGGYFVFDTVAFEPTINLNDQQILKELRDLRDLYTRLWLNYCQDYQPSMSPNIDLKSLPRYTIKDNTTSTGFYFREVPTYHFIEYIISGIGGGLQLKQALTQTPDISSEEALRLGRTWIRANGFEEYYRKEILQRIKNCKVIPQNLLNGQKIDYSDINAVIEALLDYLAKSMVTGYNNIYYVFERMPETESNCIA